MKSNIFKAILLALLSIVCFRLISVVIIFLIGLILAIPVIGNIFVGLFRILNFFSGESPDANWVIICISAGISAALVDEILKKICKSNETIHLAEVIAVLLFAALNVVYLIVNAANHSSIYSNVCYLVISAIAFYALSNNTKKKNNKTAPQPKASGSTPTHDNRSEAPKPKSENRVCVEAWDGTPVWVPESRVSEYLAEQEDIKARDGEMTPGEQKLADAIAKRMKERYSKIDPDDTEDSELPF